MLKRKIEKKLAEWKETPSHNPLIIKGCRQCGKTYSALLFAQDNKKFQYSLIKKRSSAEYFEGCLQWLVDAGIINKCHNLTITELPLEGNAVTDVFKVYVADIGLLVSMLEDGTQADILQGFL